MAVAFGVNLVLFLTTYLIWTPGFEFNDDPMMMLLAAGVGRTIEPSIFLNFSSVIAGWLLKQLYAISMDVPWYSLYLIAGLFTAHSSFLYMMIRRNPRVSSLLLYLVYFALVGVNLLLNLQFTISSVMIGLAGFALVFTDGLENEESDRTMSRSLSSPSALVGALLIVASALIRERGAVVLAGALAAPVLAVLLRRRPLRRLIPPIAIAGTALLMCWGSSVLYDAVCSTNPDCNGSRTLNRAAVQILDNNAHMRVEPETRVEYPNSVGWSEVDFALFATWFYMDEERYSVDTLETLVAKYPSWNVQLAVKDVAAILARILEDPFVLNSATIFCFFLVFLVFEADNASVIAVTAVAVFALIFGLVIFLRPPAPRVYLPIFAYLGLLPLLLLYGDRVVRRTRAGPFRKCVGSVLLVLVLARSADAVASYQEQSARNAGLQAYHADAIRKLEPTSDQLFLAWTGAMAWQFVDPFGRLDWAEGLVAVDSRPFPSTRQALRHFAIDDIHLALVTRDDVFLVVHAKRGDYRLKILQQYMLDHYDLAVAFQRTARNSLFDVYSVSAEPAERTPTPP